MSPVPAIFYSRLRYITEGQAESNGAHTDSMISMARSLAEAWIDSTWKSEPGRPAIPAESLTGALKEFWNHVILAAKYSPAAGRQQPKIIDLIQRKVNETGTLTRVVSSEGKIVTDATPTVPGNRIEIAETPEGIVWSDLPCLRYELFEAFLRPPPITPAEQWTNLNAFVARVTAAGVRDLGFYAIWAMYDALEVAQNLQRKTMSQTPPSEISIMDRLPAVVVWLEHCGPQILQACQAGTVPPGQTRDGYVCKWSRDGPEYVGYLAQQAGIDRAGFSIGRWAFWKKRLEEIRDEAQPHQATRDVAVTTVEALNLMDSIDRHEHHILTQPHYVEHEAGHLVSSDSEEAESPARPNSPQ